MPHTHNPTPPYLGAAYYPEAWPLEHVDADIERMLEAGMNVMRMAEFAWQVDNEVYATNCRCPVCVRKFREKLRARYGSIDALNQAWGLGTWSQCFQSFEQIPFPRKDTWHHPSLKHAWSSFQSDSAVEHVMAHGQRAGPASHARSRRAGPAEAAIT
jgi:beta-galactosidase GanA